MVLEESLQRYLDDCLTEKPFITVETSFYRDLTKEELDFINRKLKPANQYVVCFKCDTCIEYTDGKEPFHIDRISK